MTDQPENRYSEIELEEILRVIWKWKYLIVAGILAFAALAAVVSLHSPKVYRVSTALKLSVISVDRRGDKIYIDTPSNIKALIEAGTFNADLREHFKTFGKKSEFIPLKFQISILRGSNVLKISYETPIIENGIRILEYLPNLILEEYDEVRKQFESEYENEIRARLKQIIDLEQKKSDARSDVNSIKKRLKELESQIHMLEKNSNLLAEDPDVTHGDKQEKNLNEALLYSNILHQNVTLLERYNKQYFDYQLKKEQSQHELESIEGKLRIVTEEMKELKRKRDNLKYIEILQTPKGNRRPVKPNITFNVIMASSVGLVIMLFLTFLLEYLSKYKTRKK